MLIVDWRVGVLFLVGTRLGLGQVMLRAGMGLVYHW